MRYSIDLGARLQAAFGIGYRVTPQAREQMEEKYSGLEVFPSAIPTDYNAPTGEPLFDVIKLLENERQVHVFDVPPLIDFARSKQITTTTINDGGGEVVESWGTKSWEIRIRGIVVDMEDHLYPYNQVQRLDSLFNKEIIYGVEGQLFTIRNILYLYCVDIEFPAMEDFQDTQPYVIRAKAHQPVALLKA